MPRVMGQNSITRSSKENAVIAYGHKTLNLRLGRDQIVRLETAIFFAVCSIFESGGMSKH